MLSKYSKHSISDTEIEDQYDKLSKYSKRSITVRKIEHQYEKQSKYLQSQQEETIAERVKFMPRKRKKRNRNQNLNSKQTINQTSSIISSNKSWK